MLCGDDGEVETLGAHGKSMSDAGALAMGLQLCTMENLGDQPKSRLVKVIQELAGSNPEVERRVESLLTSMVLREQLIKQLDKVEKLDTICPEDIYTSGWLSGYISHLPGMRDAACSLKISLPGLAQVTLSHSTPPPLQTIPPQKAGHTYIHTKGKALEVGCTTWDPIGL